MYCPICKHSIRVQSQPGYRNETYCSYFCAETAFEEKQKLTNLQKGEFGVWPCSGCGSIIEGEYDPDGSCAACAEKTRIVRATLKVVRMNIQSNRDALSTANIPVSAVLDLILRNLESFSELNYQQIFGLLESD